MDLFWWLLWIFWFVAYIYVVIVVITDLFRDDKLSGWFKALWIIALVFVPFLTALVYVIARGSGMAQRARERYVSAPENDDYKPAASSSPAWLTPRATSVRISSTRAWTMRASVWRERTRGFRPPIEGTSTVSSSSTRVA